VTEDLDGLRFKHRDLGNDGLRQRSDRLDYTPRAITRDFLILLQPFAPHLAEELFSKLGPSEIALSYSPWPKYDPALLVENTIEMPVQVNGKLRDKLTLPANASEQEIESAALASEKVQSFLAGKTIKKVIVVSGKLVNIVAT